ASPQDILQAVWDTGMVGLGGAAFPSHAKLSVPKQAKVHTLVVNGCECEPYLTCDHRVMVEEADPLIIGIRYAMRATGAVRTIVGVEDNKPDAVDAIQAAIDRARSSTTEGEIFVEAVPTKYPQGSEKMLIMALFGVEVPSGGLPVQLGMVVNNVGTLAALGRLLPAGRGLTERVVTVTGPGVARPGDYRMPLGTPLSFVLEYAGAPADSRQVILGGPMMGQSAATLDVPITKGVSGVLVFKGDDLEAREGLRTFPCIKCGECVESCPMGLNPSQLGMLAAKREYEAMGERYHLGDCFECGCCTYVCPSNIPLVQQFRIAKQVLRERAV
ncbi:MAG: electron transport complex subunit RsxC, partial [Rhodocyclaceae bacterium]|nr:electron transport complex subunit RsxC [Rhodocyclaceae bacterium]